MIPILDLKRQLRPIRAEVDAAIKRVLDNADFVFSKETDELERDIAKYCKVKYAVGVSNGTDAIKLALISLGIGPGDGVICPSFTYYATAGAAASTGAVPVFADIDPDTYTISADSVDKIIEQEKKLSIKAILPVHLYGQCADMDKILKIAKRHNLKIVEDVAQAFGAGYKGKKAGTMGDCGAVSFFPGKNLGAAGDAGAVLTNSRKIYEMLRLLRNQGNKEKYRHQVIGFNNRLDAMQAVILKVKLKYFDSWNRRRQENAEFYNLNFKNLPLKIPFVPRYSNHIYHQYVLRLSGSNKRIVEYLRNQGIDARIYYPKALHMQECFKNLGYKKGDFPESEKACVETFAIPGYPDLTRKEKYFIVKSVKGFFKNE